MAPSILLVSLRDGTISSLSIGLCCCLVGHLTAIGRKVSHSHGKAMTLGGPMPSVYPDTMNTLFMLCLCLPVAESHSVCLAVWSLFHGKCSLVGVTSYTWTCHYDRPIIRPFPQTSDPSKFPFFSLQFLIKKPHQCHPTISSSVVPFSSCPQSLPASESFPMSQLFA